MKRSSIRSLACQVSLAGSVALSTSLFSIANAASQTWDGGTAGTGTAWLTAANWAGDPTAPGATGSNANADVATFGATGTGTPIGINMTTAGGNYSLGAIDWARTTGTTVNNSSTTTAGLLRLNGATVGGVANTLIRVGGSQNLTITDGSNRAMGVVLGATSGIFEVASSRVLTIGSIVSGVGTTGYAKTGAGTVFLSGSSNTFTGNIDLQAGTIQANNDGNFGNTHNDITVSGNSTLLTNFGGTVTLNTSRSITLTADLNLNGQGGNNRSWRIDGSISGAGKLSIGGLTTNVTLSGANSNSGQIAIAAGGQTSSESNHTVLQVGTGAANTTATLGNGSNAVTLGGFAEANEGVAGLNGSSVLRFTRDDYTFSGPISGAGIVDISLNDTANANGSAITLSGDNSYTGMTRIFQGALKVASAWDGSTGALSTANLRFDQHAVLIIAGDLDTGNAADFTRGVGTGANQVQWTNGGGFAAAGADRTVDIGGSGASFSWSSIGTSNALFFSHPDADAKLVFTNPLDLTATAGNRNFRVHNGSAEIDGEISAAITGGAGVGITKSDAGTLLLSGNSTYDGTTLVNAGTLLVNGSLGNTAVSVSSGATLGGIGAIGGSVTVAANGTLAPGNSAGILTINNNLNLGGVLAMEINGLAAGSHHDQVALNGSGVLGGTLSLVWNLSTLAALNSEIVLIDNNLTDGFTGAFTNAANLSLWNDNLAGQWELRYSGGTGNDLTLVAIPEPGAIALGLLGVVTLLRRRRS
jgi:autotransporter-associated beta strand protein